jgi:predicted NUDIX family NTP pyrophosphohydrolase
MGHIEVLLVHPGGPFWLRKDEGAWSIAKGEYAEGEDPLDAAKREFMEETGYEAQGVFLPLGKIKAAKRKSQFRCGAVEKDLDAQHHQEQPVLDRMATKVRQKMQEFPEVTEGAGFLSPKRERRY